MDGIEDFRKLNSKSTNTMKVFGLKRNTLGGDKSDLLTPFEMKIIKERIDTDSYYQNQSKIVTQKYSDSIIHPKISSKNSDNLSYLSRLQVNSFGKANKLSPRLEEFCNEKKDIISKIIEENEIKK
jgi:hypothetical protein